MKKFEYLSVNDDEQVAAIKDYVIPMCIKDNKADHYIGWDSLRTRINNILTSEKCKVNEDKLLGPFFISKNMLDEIKNNKEQVDELEAKDEASRTEKDNEALKDIYPVDEQKKDYCFGIYDAKYYCIDYQIHGDKVIISGQPGVGDVTKQYLYQLAFDDFIMKQGYRYVQNMFFCPDEVGDKQYGWVQMEILNHIGNKRLENIAVVKLCASKMYQLYLDNQTISEHEINQYIPDIGRQEISEQNFANRMLAYLMRITNASKMAEEKLEMKADKGKLIYPRQIKRELGAKIIYDAICPVASKAFYGFNPYEKENYGTMVAEDIGNSYGRCNQIADASIEIEKKIKELSEKELQDEKVIIDILRKCFEGKEDIASMAEGDNLEMLVEKVMELVRNLYL